jgi:hypothetical protein
MGGRRRRWRRPVADGSEELRPYLELAREIQAEVSRVAADGVVGPDALVEAIGRIPDRERDRVVKAAFDRLAPGEQWAVIERTFGDEVIRRHLADRRAELVAAVARAERVSVVRAAHRFDTTLVEVGEQLVLGLFPEAGAGVAIAGGQASAGCARRLVLRATAAGRFQVIEDVFDPGGNYFVTARYDRAAWDGQRLRGHASVRVGSCPEGVFEPVLYPGGRLDVELSGGVIEGPLHIGFAVLDGVDVFVDE